MTRKELIQLIQYTSQEDLENLCVTITEEDAESILDDFINETFLEEDVKELEDKEYLCKITPPQDRPERYASRELNGMDVIDLVEHWNLSFAEGNILKYLLRDKGEDIQDLEKIKVYADRRIKQLKK